MIYALRNKNTNEVRYVGKTKRRLSDRLCGHIHGAIKKGSTAPKSQWIREIGKENVEIISLENGYNDDEAEIWWMKYLEFLGCDLLNVAKHVLGGTNGRILSKDEQIELLEKYKDPTINVSTICEEYDICHGTLTEIRRDWGVKKVSRSPSNFIELSEEQRNYIVRQYNENYTTDRELSEELDVSRNVVRRVLKEEDVEFHSREDYIAVGKIDAPNDGIKVEDDVKEKIISVYKETGSITEACKSVSMGDHYDMIYNRLNKDRRGPTWVEVL